MVPLHVCIVYEPLRVVHILQAIQASKSVHEERQVDECLPENDNRAQALASWCLSPSTEKVQQFIDVTVEIM